MDILDAQFRQREQGWQLRLLPRGHDPHEWHDWSAPLDDPQQLFASLFDTERGWALLREPWHLRLQPERLGNHSQGIPAAPWSHLIHPEYQRPILDLDWTVTELIAQPLRAKVSGQICVVSNRGLAESLQRTVGPIVSNAESPDLPEQSIVVVGDRTMSDAQICKLQDAALEQRCPLIVLCGSDSPPRPRKILSVPCIFSTEAAREPDASWLTRLLVRVLSGMDPVLAFAEAGRAGPLQDRFVRRMWGAYDEWKPPDSAPTLALPKHWYISLDRSDQESYLNTLVEGLLSSPTRRIQVVVTPGPEGSGLDLFRQRKPKHIEPPKLVEWDLGWAEDAARTIQRLKSFLDCRSELDIAHRLQERAARYEGGALFLIRHETVSIESQDGTFQVTLDELSRYAKSLETLAHHLATMVNVHLLVHLSVLGAKREDLVSLETQDAHFMVDVLETLDLGVPKHELRQWARARGLKFSLEELDQLKELNYDQLIQRIVQRFPELIGV